MRNSKGLLTDSDVGEQVRSTKWYGVHYMIDKMLHWFVESPVNKHVSCVAFRIRRSTNVDFSKGLVEFAHAELK